MSTQNQESAVAAMTKVTLTVTLSQKLVQIEAWTSDGTRFLGDNDDWEDDVSVKLIQAVAAKLAASFPKKDPVLLNVDKSLQKILPQG